MFSPDNNISIQIEDLSNKLYELCKYTSKLNLYVENLAKFRNIDAYKKFSSFFKIGQTLDLELSNIVYDLNTFVENSKSLIFSTSQYIEQMPKK